MIEISKRNYFLKSVALLSLLYLSYFLIFVLVEYLFFSLNILSEENFLNWDAGHYYTIMKDGYRTGMLAFFPLFSFMWHFLNLNVYSINILNGAIYIVSFAWLASEYRISIRNLILLASIPSMIFMFLPFSESIFFFSTAMVLVGYNKNNLWLTAIGVFLAGLCRPVASIFIPAIILAEYLSIGNLKASFKKNSLLILLSLTSIFMVFFLQYWQTGEWFVFFKVQKGWDNYFRIPSLPLSSWSGGLMTRVDAISLFVGVVALVILINLIIKRTKSKRITLYNNAAIFSVSYLAILSVIVLFTKGGVFNSFNRYLFATTFAVLFLNEQLKREVFGWRNVAILFFITTCFWFLFASYVHIQAFLKFEILSAYVILFLLASSHHKTIQQLAFITLFMTNSFFVLLFFHRFLSSQWIG